MYSYRLDIPFVIFKYLADCELLQFLQNSS